MQSRINLAAQNDVSWMTCLRSNIGGAWRGRRMDALTSGAAICAAPLSIAIAESFLNMALAARIVYTIRNRTRLRFPQVFRWWCVWAVLEVASWLHSPQLRTGIGEMKHLLLIAALFSVLPSLHRLDDRMAVWRGIFACASLGSAALVCGFVARVIRYRHEIAARGDTAFYLRTGGLLHHWMIYSAVEVLVFGALLEFRSDYPEERWWTTPALAINCLAICLSLTRALWSDFLRGSVFYNLEAVGISLNSGWHGVINALPTPIPANVPPSILQPTAHICTRSALEKYSGLRESRIRSLTGPGAAKKASRGSKGSAHASLDRRNTRWIPSNTKQASQRARVRLKQTARQLIARAGVVHRRSSG